MISLKSNFRDLYVPEGAVSELRVLDVSLSKDDHRLVTLALDTQWAQVASVFS